MYMSEHTNWLLIGWLGGRWVYVQKNIQPPPEQDSFKQTKKAKEAGKKEEKMFRGSL